MIKTYWINCKHFCCSADVENGIVIDSAPIIKWGKGKKVMDVIDFYRKKGSLINYTILEGEYE